MKVFLVIWICVQSSTLPLNQTCVSNPSSEIFDNLQQCLMYLDDYSLKIKPLKNVYMTGFCTEKIMDNI
jgi:hypothetical protein